MLIQEADKRGRKMCYGPETLKCFWESVGIRNPKMPSLILVLERLFAIGFLNDRIVF